MVLDPAVTDDDAATTVDWAPLAAPATKVTDAVAVTVRLSLASVAVKVAVPAA